ncbi:hypothetical protein DFS34DRAFT_618302 [Phlyctochytrium arcticum]|nr:hypothetical protein DFS34DRAFT_618302 [Phlyctochytrium arcticum]
MMAFTSAALLAVTVTQKCPSRWFYVLEWILNGSMLLEVAIRFLALGKLFWTSYWNVVDVCLVPLCLLTLFLLSSTNCDSTARREAEMEEILLILRNVVMLGRLIMVVKKNHKQLSARTAAIDFSAVSTGKTLDGMGDIIPHDFALPMYGNGQHHWDGEDDFI